MFVVCGPEPGAVAGVREERTLAGFVNVAFEDQTRGDQRQRRGHVDFVVVVVVAGPFHVSFDEGVGEDRFAEGREADCNAKVR